MEPAVLERARALEHVRYATAAEETPALLEAAAARLRALAAPSAGQRLWLALLAHGRHQLLLRLIGTFPESELLRDACPLPELVGRISEGERASLLEQARTDHARERAALVDQKQQLAEAGPVIAAYLDVEASSLADASYPIEVGWAALHTSGYIDSGGWLISPEPDWADWSADAEAIHQIPRVMVETLGTPAAEVVARLDQLLGDGVVYSDAPEREAQWVGRLYAAVGAKRRWRIGEAHAVLQSLVATDEEREVLARWRTGPRCHRAEADAYLLAVTHRGLRELAARRR